MGECINLRRGNPMGKKFLPVLDSNYPANVTTDRKNDYVELKVEIAIQGNPEEYTYQWYNNGSAVEGAIYPVFNFSALHDIGIYLIYCEVTNSAGTVQSRTATVELTDTFLFNNGDQCTVLTGGYELRGQMGMGASYGTTIQMSIVYQYGREGVVYTKNKINISDYKQICFDVNVTYQGGYSFSVGVLPSNSAEVSPSFSAKQTVTTTGSRTMTVDISGLSGSYYIAMHSDVAEATISKIYLKR